MPRVRRFSHTALLGTALALVASAASAQSLLRPEPDGAPQQFGKPGEKARPTTRTFGNPAASGAARTGFDSTNTRKTPPRPAAAKPVRPPPPPPLPAQARAANARAQAVISAQNPQPVTGAFSPTPGTLVRRPKPPPDLEPFEPVGIRAGSFLLKPAIEVTGGYDSNPERSLSGKGSALMVVAPELSVKSLWSRHELRGELRSSYTTYSESMTPSLDRPFVDARVFGRVDVHHDTKVDLETRFLLSTDNPGSPNLQAGLAKLPIFTTVGGTAGVTQTFNRFEVALKGSVDRTAYSDSELTDGTTASNEDRNYVQYGSTLRGSYELTPGVKPFVEVGVDRRVHDSALNCFCELRDSRGNTVKAGSTFELSRLLTGEFSIGYLNRSYDDNTLPELNGLLIDGSLIWTVSGLTTARFTARTTVDETTISGVSGIFRRDLGVQVDHAFRHWLVGTARFGYGLDTYPGSEREDQRYLISGALTYKYSRNLHLKAEVRHEWLRSTFSGNDFDATTMLLGVRLMR